MGRSLGIAEIIVIALVVLLLFGGKLIPRAGNELGRRARTGWRQARWIWTTMFGGEEQIIRAEREFGQEIAREFLRAHPGGAEDREATAAVASKLTAKVAQPWQFSVQVIAGEEENAYALPGGYIFVTSSLLRLCERDEQEIAFILSHEMAHVLLAHARERYLAGAFLSAVASRTPAFGHLLAQLVKQGYSRDQELEADRKAAALAKAAGFDPAAAVRLLARLERAGRGSNELDEYFSSHPPFAERIEALRRAA